MIRTLLVCALLASTPAVAAESLALGKGTAEISGSATVDLLLGDNTNTLVLNLHPQAGLFLAERAELIGGVSLVLANGVSAVGVSAGGRYVAPMGAHHAYAGGTFNYGETQFLGWEGSSTSVTALGGFLFPLNRRVAADVGARIHLPLEGGAIHIPMGYFGIAGFFGGA